MLQKEKMKEKIKEKREKRKERKKKRKRHVRRETRQEKRRGKKERERATEREKREEEKREKRTPPPRVYVQNASVCTVRYVSVSTGNSVCNLLQSEGFRFYFRSVSVIISAGNGIFCKLFFKGFYIFAIGAFFFLQVFLFSGVIDFFAKGGCFFKDGFCVGLFLRFCVFFLPGAFIFLQRKEK